MAIVYCDRCNSHQFEQFGPFVFCKCKHIFCNDCRRRDRKRTKDSMYCVVCRKTVKFKYITSQHLRNEPNRRSESNKHLGEFLTCYESRSNIQHNFTQILFQKNKYWNKVADQQDAHIKQLEARCRYFEYGISELEKKSLEHMSRERYMQLLNMADYKIDRMTYQELVGGSSFEDHVQTHSTPLPRDYAVPDIDTDAPLLRQVLLKNAFSSSSSNRNRYGRNRYR